MPGIYTVNFTDGAKSPITIPPLVVNNATSLTMVGYRTPVYGEAIWENFLHLLEHFSRNSSPTNPIQGQLWSKKVAEGDEIYVFDPRVVTNTEHTNWHSTDTAGILSQAGPPSDTRMLWYDTTRKALRYWDGARWDALTTISTLAAPVNPYPGQLWHDVTLNVLKYWGGSNWLAITTVSSSTPPVAPYNGQVWHDTTPTAPTLRYWNGTSWVALTNIFKTTPPANPYRGQVWVNSTFTPGIAYFYDSTYVSDTIHPNWHLLSTGVTTSTTTPPLTTGLWFNPANESLNYWNGTAWVNILCFALVKACDYNEIVASLNQYLASKGQATVATVADPVSNAQWTTLLNRVRDVAVAENVGIPSSAFAYSKSTYCATDTCGFLTAVEPFDAVWDTLTIVTGDAPPSTEPSYTVLSYRPTINEGSYALFEVITENVPLGSTLYWTTTTGSGTIDSGDFVSGTTSGSFPVGLASTLIVREIREDLATEGDETFSIAIRTGAVDGPVVASSDIVKIVDTSKVNTGYVINRDAATVNEVETATFTVTTVNIPAGTVLYWSTYTDAGTITAGDFDDGQLTGSVTIGTSGTATISRKMKDDLVVEGIEGFGLRLHTGSPTGPVVATSLATRVTDGTTPSPTYAVTRNNSTVDEGGTATFTVTTTNVPTGTQLYWSTLPFSLGTVTFADFADSTTAGTVTVVGGTGSISRTLSNDLATEGEEKFAIILRKDGPTGEIVATSEYTTINDTSTTPVPSYEIEPSVTSVNEGSTVTFTVTTENAPPGQQLFWSTLAFSGSTITQLDFADQFTTGSVNLNSSGVATITRTLANDSTTEGEEKFAILVRTGSQTGTIVATSEYVTINDTSLTPAATYSITPNLTSVNEGGSVQFTVTTTGIPDGTTVYWTTKPGAGSTITAGDFDDGNLYATVAIYDNAALFTRGLTSDTTTEGTETFAIELRTGSETGTIVATSSFVTINDTSVESGMELEFTTVNATTGGRTVAFAVGVTSSGVTVDWGDGTPVQSVSSSGEVSHTYASEGTFVAKIFGNLPTFGRGDATVLNRDKLRKVLKWSPTTTNLENAFLDSINLTQVPATLPSAVTTLRATFRGATSFNQNISGWDTSNITNTSLMFRDAAAFNQPLASWDVGAVTNMEQMFFGAAAFNQDLTVWDTSLVTNMNLMFANATEFNNGGSNGINGWQTASVTDVAGMFSGTKFNQPIGAWDTAAIVNMANMFGDTPLFNQSLSGWDTTNVTTMSNLFRNATSYNQAMGNFDTSNVTDMNFMFKDATAFDQPIGGWDTSNVTAMQGMFQNATSFNRDLSNWTTGLNTHPPSFSSSANTTWVANKATLFPFLSDGTTRINT